MSSSTRLDPERLSPRWPGPRRFRPLPGWFPWLSTVLALLLAVGAVTALGGWQKRSDQLVTMAPGATLDCHNLVLTLVSATAQRTGAKDEPSWEVLVHGTAINPNDETLSVVSGESGQFAAKAYPQDLISIPSVTRFGAESDPLSRTGVPPGGIELPMTVKFEFPPEYSPSGVLAVLAVEMEHTANDVLNIGGGEKTWNSAGGRGYLVYVPVTVLPDDTY